MLPVILSPNDYVHIVYQRAINAKSAILQNCRGRLIHSKQLLKNICLMMLAQHLVQWRKGYLPNYRLHALQQSRTVSESVPPVVLGITHFQYVSWTRVRLSITAKPVNDGFVRNLLLSLQVKDFMKIGPHLAKLHAYVEWHLFSGRDVKNRIMRHNCIIWCCHLMCGQNSSLFKCSVTEKKQRNIYYFNRTNYCLISINCT